TTVVAGNPTTYTITVANAGPSAVTGAAVNDTFPATLTGVTWTCTPAGTGASCGATSGTGNIATTVNLPAGTSATFTATARSAAACSPPGSGGGPAHGAARHPGHRDTASRDDGSGARQQQRDRYDEHRRAGGRPGGEERAGRSDSRDEPGVHHRGQKSGAIDR